MLDFSTRPEVPAYTIKLRNGETRSYDALLLSFQLRPTDGIDDPAVIQELVNKILELELNAIDAMIVLEDLTTFVEEHLEEPLKKALGQEPCSTSSTDSRPKNSEPSAPKNTSD